MSKQEISFYQHLDCVIAGGAYRSFVIKDTKISSDFSVAMMSLPKLTAMTMLFFTKLLNNEAYEQVEGTSIESQFDSYVEDNLTEEEYNKLTAFLFMVTRNG